MGRFKREAYLDYDEEEVLCGCGKRAPLITSWTRKNPGRRFFCCLKEDGCGFWEWHDLKLEKPKFSHYCNLLKELREDNCRLIAEVKLLKKQSYGGPQASFCSTVTNELKEEVSNNEGLGVWKLGFLFIVVVTIWCILF